MAKGKQRYRVKNDTFGFVAGEIVEATGKSERLFSPTKHDHELVLEVVNSVGMKGIFNENDLERVFDSTSEERTTNNVMRHEYKSLSDAEKDQMLKVKDLGLEFFDYLTGVGESRELSLAKTKIEEAVMWAVKHITK